MTQQPRTPTTEAGRALLAAFLDQTDFTLNSFQTQNMRRDILAIEAEARADLLAQIEKAVLAIPVQSTTGPILVSHQREARMKESCLAAIRSAAPVEPESVE